MEIVFDNGKVALIGCIQSWSCISEIFKLERENENAMKENLIRGQIFPPMYT